MPPNALRLYNTLARRVEEFVPRDPARVTFYTCGPTVYDDAHIGNFRSFLAADLLRRWIESPLCALRTRGGDTHQGPRTVVHVMNITDVGHMTDDAEGGEHGEDRMAVAGRRIAEAKKSGKLPADAAIDPTDPYQIARFYEQRFRDDAKKLGLKLVLQAEHDATLMPRATDAVPGMIRLIERLIERKNAYVVGPDGQRVVYFRVSSFPAYGKLSGNTLDRLREGAGGRISGENQSAKEHPADFLLWKEDASHIMKWDSPWGAGYPGWHIECSVMSAQRLLGKPGLPLTIEELAGLVIPDAEPIIDLHSGGEDNIFPHHECEIAQSCCAFNETPQGGSYAAMWFHPRFLFVEGEKMSKSKGNFFTARDLFAKGYEPAAVRLELIRTHYRSNANFTEQGLKDAQRMVERWRRLQGEPMAKVEHTDGDPAAERAVADFAAAMSDDLNIAGAIAAVNTFVGTVEQPTPQARAAMSLFDSILSVLVLERAAAAQTSMGLFMDGLAADPGVLAKLEERAAARKNKDFARSDQIRDELLAMGYAIKDVAGGKVEVRRG
jgi:cysteinyl-tRNA synthetase